MDSKSSSGQIPYFRIKIISVGDSCVGKSCMIKRFCEERFIEKYITTIGIDYGVKQMNILGEKVKVNFWDLSGNDQFLEVRNEFYRDSQGGILVYDSSNRESFLHLDKWLKESREYGGSDVIFCLCANKCDLKQVVTSSEGRAWAEKNGFKFLETSAKSGKNITELFNYLFTAVTSKILKDRQSR